MLPGGAFEFGPAQSGHPPALPALDNAQAVGALKLGTHPGEGLSILPDLHPAAVDGGPIDPAMWMCWLPCCAHAVADRHPGRRPDPPSRNPIVAIDHLGDLRPLLVGQSGAHRRPATRTRARCVPRRVFPIGVVGGIERRSEVGDLGCSERPPSSAHQDDPGGDDPLVGVLVGPPGTEEIADESPARLAPWEIFPIMTEPSSPAPRHSRTCPKRTPSPVPTSSAPPPAPPVPDPRSGQPGRREARGWRSPTWSTG